MMRKWKIRYGKGDGWSSERVECDSFEEAVKYGESKAKALGLRFLGVDEVVKPKLLFDY